MKTLAPLALAVLTCACTHRVTDFTFLSTKNVDLSQAAFFERGDKRAIGEDTKYIIIIYPIGIPNVKEATDRAIESVPGAIGLVDGVIYRQYFGFPFIFGVDKFVVEGTPLINKKAIKISGITGAFMVSEFVESTQTFVTRSVNAAEYAEMRAKLIGNGHATKVGSVASTS